MLEGAGGNIGVSVGPDGILIVDDQFAPLAEKIRAALKGLGEGKLKFILNTHWHGDHTGGNVVFGPEAPIIAQTNVRKRLAEGSNVPNRAVKPAPQRPAVVTSIKVVVTSRRKFGCHSPRSTRMATRDLLTRIERRPYGDDS